MLALYRWQDFFSPLLYRLSYRAKGGKYRRGLGLTRSGLSGRACRG